MKHFVLLLYAGDYRDAVGRRSQGLADRYRHHSYALDVLERLREGGTRVSVIQVRADKAYDEVHLGGVRFVGLAPDSKAAAAAAVASYLDEEDATHVMVRFPAPEMLEAVVALPVRVAVVLADSFPGRFRNRKAYREMGRLLRSDAVDFVSNHHLNASRQLVRILGLRAQRVIPWDWPLDLVELSTGSAKSQAPGGELRLCFVGTIHRIKGVWDLVDAVRILRERGEPVRLEIAGSGAMDELHARVDAAGLAGHVDVLGRIGGDEVVEMMRRSTFVVVPSRPNCPEGLPLTLYEAMASGTPVVASDHPMFKKIVRDGETGFVFPAGRPRRLAGAVLRGWRDPEAYTHVSRLAAGYYSQLGLSTLWGDLVDHWVRGGSEDQAWLSDRSLAAMDR